MPVVKEEGKDTIIFVTKEEHHGPKTVQLEEEEEYGLIKPNGEINWDCPCLQGMADGPCGQQFRAAFSCFHYSEAEPKGSDCIPQFRDMQSCFQEYPDIYGGDDEEKEGDLKGVNGQEALAEEDKGAGTSELPEEEKGGINAENDIVVEEAKHNGQVNSDAAHLDDTTQLGKPVS